MRDAYLEAMSRAANSVTVVTTDGAAGRAGVTVSAMCSVSVEGPAPSLLVCVHEASPARQAIAGNAVFCANLLAEHQHWISDIFAGRTGAKQQAKFDGSDWETRATGAPVLVGALAAFDCRVVQHHAVGSHYIFVGQVESIDCAEANVPLVYHDRQYGSVKRLATS